MSENVLQYLRLFMYFFAVFLKYPEKKESGLRAVRICESQEEINYSRCDEIVRSGQSPPKRPSDWMIVCAQDEARAKRIAMKCSSILQATYTPKYGPPGFAVKEYITLMRRYNKRGLKTWDR